MEIHRALKQVGDVHHLMYGNDISIWIKTGSPGHIQTQLPEALIETQEAGKTTGLTCSAEKNESARSWSQQKPPPIQITL
ncbi:hypothetical protein HPB48_013078 [Haemaphysalis longicornis]|uniref:Uncharacterized protein n=1 Tax=Haemaphysalis longicornis TaxID=44386 RepID=A0A9J6G6T2_HAELO|nr:hypothetical protein HPB48_013078 [Haemaphysalis longicornis]